MWTHYEPRAGAGARVIDSFLALSGATTVVGSGSVQIWASTAFLPGSSLSAAGGATGQDRAAAISKNLPQRATLVRAL